MNKTFVWQQLAEIGLAAYFAAGPVARQLANVHKSGFSAANGRNAISTA